MNTIDAPPRSTFHPLPGPVTGLRADARADSGDDSSAAPASGLSWATAPGTGAGTPRPSARARDISETALTHQLWRFLLLGLTLAAIAIACTSCASRTAPPPDAFDQAMDALMAKSFTGGDKE